MYCVSCGNIIIPIPGAKFCTKCGKQVSDDLKREVIKEKIFNWGILSNNKSAVSEVNKWLKSNRIRILDITLQGGLSILKIKSNLNYLKIQYVESDEKYTYQMSYFEKLKLIGRNFSELDKKLENWKKTNPNKEVVFDIRSGSRYWRGDMLGSVNSMNTYFVYRYYDAKMMAVR